MAALADMVVSLLCGLTFQPQEGHDPEFLADLEQSWWQTLIHDLSPAEQSEVRAAVERQLENLRSVPPEAMPEHLQTQQMMLEAFLRGELQQMARQRLGFALKCNKIKSLTTRWSARRRRTGARAAHLFR